MVLRERISKILRNFQYLLFPELENLIGQLSPLHKKIVSVLELILIEEFIPSSRFNFGRPVKNRSFIARSYIASRILKLPFTKQLIERLKQDKQLRFICGWQSINDIPSESTFSRAFEEFSKSSLPEKVHQALIQEVYEDEILCHVVRDSTPIDVREKPIKKANAKDREKLKKRKQERRKKTGELNLRQKQLKEDDLEKMLEGLPKHCDKGMKKSAQGYTMIWKGYKLHTTIDDNCVL